MEDKNKSKMQISVLIGVIGILLLISFVNAGFTSDYSNENPANVGPGETKTINLLRLLNGGSDTVRFKIELINGGGVASYVGKDEIDVGSGRSEDIAVKITIPNDIAEGTKYDLTFRSTEITTSGDTGMISFTKTSTYTTSVFVKKPTEPAPVEKPAADYGWYIIVLVIVIIIAIVAYFLLRTKNLAKSK